MISPSPKPRLRGRKGAASEPSRRISTRSRRRIQSRLGRCTFTATQWPSARRARYTWPRLAAAIGWSGNSTNSWWAGAPSSCSIVARATPWGKGGRLSCSWVSSSSQSRRTRSGRVERAWPTLMKQGPSRVRVRRMRWPRRRWVAASLLLPCTSSTTTRLPSCQSTLVRRPSSSHGRSSSQRRSASGR